MEVEVYRIYSQRIIPAENVMAIHPAVLVWTDISTDIIIRSGRITVDSRKRKESRNVLLWRTASSLRPQRDECHSRLDISASVSLSLYPTQARAEPQQLS